MQIEIQRLRTDRRGAMLHEIAVLIATSCVLILLSIQLLHRSLQVVKRGKTHTQLRMVIASACKQFREDVHRASSAKVLEDGRLSLGYPDDSSITYELLDGPKTALRREWTFDSQQPSRLESYRIEIPCRVVFNFNSQTRGVTMQLVGTHPTDELVQRSEARVAAQLGRWRNVELANEATP